MANQPFDREIINTRERPLSGDINTTSTELDRSARAVLQAAFLSRNSALGMDTVPQPLVGALQAKFHGNSFRVRSTNPTGVSIALSVIVESGLGWYNSNISESGISGITGLDDPDIYKPLVNPTALTYNLGGASTPDGANPRIDIIEVKLNRLVGDPTTRDVLNPGTGIFAPATVNKTLSYVNGPITTNGVGGINYKTGLAAALPVAPATSAGYIKIGEVRVEALAAAIQQNKIMDRRWVTFPAGTGIVKGSVNGAIIGSVRGAAGIDITATQAALVTSFYIFCGNAFTTPIMLFNQFLGGVFRNTRISALVGAVVDAPTQAALAAATPPLFPAIGQDYFRLDLTHETGVEQQVFACIMSVD